MYGTSLCNDVGRLGRRSHDFSAMSPVGGVGMALLTVWTTVVAISQPTSNLNATPKRGRFRHIQRSAKRRGRLLSYSQAEPGRELTQPSPRLLAEPCSALVLNLA